MVSLYLEDFHTITVIFCFLYDFSEIGIELLLTKKVL